MSKTRKTTIAIMLSSILGLVGYDIFVATNNVEGDTISEVTLDYSNKHPSLPLAAGVLCGHLFWPANFSKKRKKNSLIALLAGGAGVVALDSFGLLSGIPPIAPFLVGIVGGHFGWSQTKKKDNSKNNGV